MKIKKAWLIKLNCQAHFVGKPTAKQGVKIIPAIIYLNVSSMYSRQFLA